MADVRHTKSLSILRCPAAPRLAGFAGPQTEAALAAAMTKLEDDERAAKKTTPAEEMVRRVSACFWCLCVLVRLEGYVPSDQTSCPVCPSCVFGSL